jgi:uncharacterized protein (DUF1778 family)
MSPYNSLIKEKIAMASMGTPVTGENQNPRKSRFETRMTREQKDLCLKAAALTGRSLSDFVIASACETAARAVREHEVMTISARDRQAFVAALLKPAEPGARLRNAARRYKQHAGK